MARRVLLLPIAFFVGSSWLVEARRFQENDGNEEISNTDVNNTDEDASEFMCHCWYNPMANPEDCCIRTDSGSANHGTKDETYQCDVQPKFKNSGLCFTYCTTRCSHVPHPNDLPGLSEWLKDKIGEVSKMGKADYYLGIAGYRARTTNDDTIPEVPLLMSSIKSIHPVGSWRPDTWKKTIGRSESVIAAKDSILQDNHVLTAENIRTNPLLQPMRSITNFLAFPFPFCGIRYVTIEGNGRLAGIRLASEKDSSLKNLTVEVDLMTYKPEYLNMVQRATASLWGQYVKEAQAMDPETEADQIKEYMSFKIPVVKCRGLNEISKNGMSGCPVVRGLGALPNKTNIVRWVKPDELVGVQRAHIVQKPELWSFEAKVFDGDMPPLKYYELCDEGGAGVEYMVGDTEAYAVKEYCPHCIDIGYAD